MNATSYVQVGPKKWYLLYIYYIDTNVNMIGQSTRSREEMLLKVVGATSSEGFYKFSRYFVL